jgi:hypothetical protein
MKPQTITVLAGEHEDTWSPCINIKLQVSDMHWNQLKAISQQRQKLLRVLGDLSRFEKVVLEEIERSR